MDAHNQMPSYIGLSRRATRDRLYVCGHAMARTCTYVHVQAVELMNTCRCCVGVRAGLGVSPNNQSACLPACDDRDKQYGASYLHLGKTLKCVLGAAVFPSLADVYFSDELHEYHDMSRKFQKFVSEHLGYVELSWNGGVEPHPFLMDDECEEKASQKVIALPLSPD